MLPLRFSTTGPVPVYVVYVATIFPELSIYCVMAIIECDDQTGWTSNGSKKHPKAHYFTFRPPPQRVYDFPQQHATPSSRFVQGNERENRENYRYSHLMRTEKGTSILRLGTANLRPGRASGFVLFFLRPRNHFSNFWRNMSPSMS